MFEIFLEKCWTKEEKRIDTAGKGFNGFNGLETKEEYHNSCSHTTPVFIQSDGEVLYFITYF